MEDWALIRRLAAEGVPKAKIARRLGIARNTVAAAVASQGPPKYERKRGSTSFTPYEASPTPVLDLERIRPGQLLVTVGPKQVGRAEFSARLAHDADLIVTDSRAQVLGYNPPHVLADLATEIVELASFAASPSTEPAGQVGQVGRAGSAGARVLFLNVGLAGAEAALLNSVL